MTTWPSAQFPGLNPSSAIYQKKISIFRDGNRSPPSFESTGGNQSTGIGALATLQFASLPRALVESSGRGLGVRRIECHRIFASPGSSRNERNPVPPESACCQSASPRNFRNQAFGDSRRVPCRALKAVGEKNCGWVLGLAFLELGFNGNWGQSFQFLDTLFLRNIADGRV